MAWKIPHTTPDVKGTYQLKLGFSMTTQSNAIAAENHTYINQLSKHVGAEVVLKGWLYNMRSSGKILFPQLRDGTGVVQCVALKNAISPELFEELKALGQESALSIRGTVRADERAPGGFEIDVAEAEGSQHVEGEDRKSVVWGKRGG